MYEHRYKYGKKKAIMRVEELKEKPDIKLILSDT